MNATRKAAVAGSALALTLAAPGLLRRLRAPADLRGRVAVVTGGSRGLGLLLARELARAGCRVAICARDPRELARAREMLERWTADVVAEPCDVSERPAVEAFVREVERRIGPVEVLVNNAGVISVGGLLDTTQGDFEEALA